MQFEHMDLLVLAPILPILAWILLKQRTYVGYSSLSLFKGVRTINLNFVQRLFICAAVVLVVIALAKPYHEETERVTTFQESRELVFVIDTSSSMSEPAQGGKKIDLAKNVLAEFVRSRFDDRIGLFSFSDKPQLEWPLCYAEELSGLHDPVFNQLESLKTSGGTNIARGLLAALDHCDALSSEETKGKAIILVSDGISTIQDDDAEEIVSRLEEGGIKLYWVFIKGAERTSESLRAHYRTQIKSVDAAVEASGGKVVETAPEDIEAAIKEIGQLEAVPIVTVEEETTQVYHFRPFLLVALALLSLAAIVEIIKEL